MNFVPLKSGIFQMGDPLGKGFVEDHETPPVMKKVHGFEIADTTVTNREFKAFVDETGYITTAELMGDSYVFHLLVPKEMRSQYAHVTGSHWWLLVPGACWRCPIGPESSIDDVMDHPVVHVSLQDALAYCDWAGVDLPTETQWEYAARGGTTTQFPWGDELEQNGKFHANTWQGHFPDENSEADGFLGTAPVKSFEPNGFGLYQMIGNVWEWCCNHRGIPFEEIEEDAARPVNFEFEYAIRGGSFLCHCSYCNRYRVATRNGALWDSTSSHLGFRCVRNQGRTHHANYHL